MGDVRSPADSEIDVDERRAERLKAALRDNLRRRKAAVRPVGEDKREPSGEDRTKGSPGPSKDRSG